MNINIFTKDHTDLEGMRSRADSLLSDSAFSARRFTTEQTAQIENSLVIAEAETPVRYDPDTEVKVGGTNGVAVLLPSGEVLIAVNEDSQREGIGRQLIDHINGHTMMQVHFNMSVYNIEGQHFTLAMGYRPDSLSTSGQITYSRDRAEGRR